MMAKPRPISILAALAALVGRGAHAFQPPRRGISGVAAAASIGGEGGPAPSTSSLGMAPRFDVDSQKWFATDLEKEGPSAGYGIVGSLYRAGPVPFFQRIVSPETYEQGVLKFMAKEGCDRIEAQGNMDAYLENPQDWAYQKMEESKGAPKKDYANANMDPKQVVLSTVWAGVVVWFSVYLVTGLAEGKWAKPEGTDLFHGNLWSLPF